MTSCSASCTGSGRPGTAAGDRPRPVRPGGSGDAPRGRIFDLKRFSTHDGPGIRTTVFFTGCPLRCAWCHNPEAFAPQPGAPAREVGVDELVRELERDLPYFDRSGGGVTLSGGEPLGQAAFVEQLLAACRRRELRTAVDTAGCVEPAAVEMAAGLSDLILYDLKSPDDAVHARWTGAGNRLVLANLELLDRRDVAVWIRLPLIPTVNDDEGSVAALAGLLLATRFRRVSLLPYHRIAAAKYRRLGLADRMAGIGAPTAAAVEAVRARLAAAGFDVRIGR